jgi:hypothetical protein
MYMLDTTIPVNLGSLRIFAANKHSRWFVLYDKNNNVIDCSPVRDYPSVKAALLDVTIFMAQFGVGYEKSQKDVRDVLESMYQQMTPSTDVIMAQYSIDSHCETVMWHQQNGERNLWTFGYHDWNRPFLYMTNHKEIITDLPVCDFSKWIIDSAFPAPLQESLIIGLGVCVLKLTGHQVQIS